jgi:hypothetical protein
MHVHKVGVHRCSVAFLKFLKRLAEAIGDKRRLSAKKNRNAPRKTLGLSLYP